MDIPLVLLRLRPGQDWGPCAQSDSTYEKLSATWRGVLPCPTRDEMLATWATIKQERDAERAAEDADAQEIARLKAKPRADWTAADVKLAIQIWITRKG